VVGAPACGCAIAGDAAPRAATVDTDPKIIDAAIANHFNLHPFLTSTTASSLMMFHPRNYHVYYRFLPKGLKLRKTRANL